MQIIEDNNFDTEIKSGLVLVDFFATWCGPCRQMLPIMEELSQSMGDKVKIVKMDIDESPKTPANLNIQTIPTLILFKDGIEVDRKVGAMPKNEVENWINQY